MVPMRGLKLLPGMRERDARPMWRMLKAMPATHRVRVRWRSISVPRAEIMGVPQKTWVAVEAVRDHRALRKSTPHKATHVAPQMPTMNEYVGKYAEKMAVIP
ncbi:hypothetical protein JCM16814_28230 [Desulfobaculum senezii]